MNYSLRQLRILSPSLGPKALVGRGYHRLKPVGGEPQRKELEGQTGVRLLDRTTREVVLTDAGQQLAARLERIPG